MGDPKEQDNQAAIEFVRNLTSYWVGAGPAPVATTPLAAMGGRQEATPTAARFAGNLQARMGGAIDDGDDDLPPTPMRLPDEPKGKQPQQKVVQMENMDLRVARPKPAGPPATLVIDNFGFGDSKVPAGRISELKKLAARLASAPGSTVRLVGHTDTVDTERFNKKLGLERAAAVRATLTAEKGVTVAQIKLDSEGEMHPAAGQPPAKLDPDKGEKNPKNRRVEVFVTWAKSTKPVQPTPQDTPTPAPVKDPEKDGARGGVTLDFEWDKEFGKWKLTYVQGSFKVKVKLKGELVQKGSGWKITEGVTANKGVKAVLELGKQKAIEIFSSLTLKEITETFEDEVSAKKVEVKIQIKATLETSVSWLSPMLTGSIVLVSVDWKKLKEDPTSGVKFAAIAFGGGLQVKGKFDVSENWEFNGSAEFTAEGSVSPNWTAIIARVAAGVAEDAAEAGVEIGAGAVSFETVIASGGVALGAMVVVGTIRTLIDGEEIRELPNLVDKTNRAFRLGFAAGILGEKAPSDPLAKAAYELGQKGFQLSKKKALAKDPSISDKAIRQAIRSSLHEPGTWKMLWWKLHPFAQQAVWDAYGSANVGWWNRNVDPTTIKYAYQAIFGEMPSESDPNFMKYYMK